MKRVKITMLLILFAAIVVAQGESKIPLLGEKAPTFTGESTQGTINFPDDFGKNWKLILSHPQDFTPVLLCQDRVEMVVLWTLKSYI